jgi:hypothetical protein
MRYKLKTVLGIEKYIIGENLVFAISNERTISDNDLIKLPIKSHKGYNPIFLTYKSSIFYSTVENVLYRYDAEIKKERKNKKHSASLISNFENIFVLRNKEGTQIVDIEKEIILSILPVRLSLVVTSSIFVIGKLGRKGKEVIVIDIRNDSSFNIPLKLKLIQVINIKDEQVLLFYVDGTVTCFDITTKEEQWSIQLVNEIESHLFSNLLFVEKYNRAYLFANSYLFELDIKERESKLVKDYNENSLLEWYFKDSLLFDDLITFTGTNTLGGFPMVAGVIDINTKEILWTTKCEPGVYYEEAPQIKDDKLYVLDSNKTLYIYEKE